MKYLKKIENFTQGYYWIVPTDKRMKSALLKIKYPLYLIDIRLNRKYDKKYIYITKRNDGFGWETDLQWLIDNDYQFMGNVNIEDYEIDAEKYNL